jgi:hypothetical protein
MRYLVVLVTGVALAGARLASGATPPPGATAQCRDGTFSFSQHRSGTCSHHGGVAAWLTSSAPAGTGAVAVGRTVLLGPRTRTTGCTRGPLPDRRCSPGAYYSGLTEVVICGAGFRTSAIRNVPQSEKFAVEKEYGLEPAFYGRTIEIDHIVPLELGGSNSLVNLFPEPGAGTANYRVKDRLENRLRELVCAGTLSLGTARVRIVSNWEALYRQVFGTAAQAASA